MYNIKEGIIVCEKQVKQQILASVVGFLDYSFMDLREFKKKLFFDYEKRAIYLLTKKYQIKPKIALNYLNNMTYIDNSNSSNEKIELLKEMKEYLKKENVIYDNSLFLERISRFNVSFVGYERSNELSLIINKTNEYTTTTFIDIFNRNNSFVVREFADINTEVRYVFREIKSLIKKGVEPNHIKLCNVTEDYLFIVNRVALLTGLKLNLNKTESIRSTRFANAFIESLAKYDNFKELINSFNKTNNHYLNHIIRVLNDYNAYSEKPLDFKEILEYELENIKYEEELYENMIEVTDFNVFDDNDYIFFLGFNNQVPHVLKDEDYLTDKIKESLGLDTSLQKNKSIKEEMIKRLKHYSNLTITYSLEGTFKRFLPSNIINELKISVIKETATFTHIEAEDNLLMTRLLDNYYKFNEDSVLLRSLYYEGFAYKTFNHRFLGISPDIYNKYALKSIKLSYSALKEYYSCSYAYFLNRVLKINDFTDTLEISLGNFAHELLMESYQEGFVFKEAVDRHLEKCIDKKEEFYFKMMADVVYELILFNNNEEKEKSLLNEVCCEKEINISYDEDKLLFTGIIDKIKYAEIDNEEVVAIIDYKTGKDVVSLNNVCDGFNLQLPIYLYLLKKSGLFINPVVVGFYLQKINPGLHRNDRNEESLEVLLKSFRLQGYSLDEFKYLEYFSNNYKNNSYIQSLKINKDGSFAKNAKIISKKQQEELVDLVENLILKAYEGIKKGEFPINPKRIAGKDSSCTFCKFSDICFKTYNDYVDLKASDFLGGEENVD